MSSPPAPQPVRSASSFRLAVYRGLGVVLPPLLTIVILLWIGRTVKDYCYDPIMKTAREVLYLRVTDIRTNLTSEDPPPEEVETADGVFVLVDGRNYVPLEVIQELRKHDGPMPSTAAGIYRRYVELEYLNPYIIVPLFLLILVLLLYLLGRLLAFGVGRFFWGLFEKGVGRLPLVNSVYSSTKQVTELMFNEREIHYTRIVALEFPAKGLWSVGFVTSEGLLDVEAAVNEPILSVLVPYAPLPVTGAVVMVRKSETIDLNITVDQAFQFIVSCGVVVPPQQLTRSGKLVLMGNGKNGSTLEGAAPDPRAEQPAGRTP